GWLAAVLGATAPLFWFYGSVGLNYGPAGALAAVVALGCVRLCLGHSPGPSVLLAGAALGALGGFRPTDEAFLLPAYVWPLWRAGAGVRAPGADNFQFSIFNFQLAIECPAWLLRS